MQLYNYCKIEKMTVSLRVIFDTNVFKPDVFDLLDQSPIRKLCKSRRIIPVYSHILLEETFRAYGVEERK